MPLGTDPCKGPKGRNWAQALYPNKKSVLFGGVKAEKKRTIKTAESNCAVTASYPREATKGHDVREQEHFLYLASLGENCGL